MSKSKDHQRPTKVQALEEVVALLRKHVRQRETEIDGLGRKLLEANERSELLEQRLQDAEAVCIWFSFKISILVRDCDFISCSVLEEMK